MATTNSYPYGTTVTLRATFSVEQTPPTVPVAYVNADPSGAITLQIRDPNGTVASYIYGVDAGVIKEAVAMYAFAVSCVIKGYWHYRWSSPGGANEADFYINPSAFAP